MKLMLDVDCVVKSIRLAQKQGHDELMNELAHVKALVGREEVPVDASYGFVYLFWLFQPHC